MATIPNILAFGYRVTLNHQKGTTMERTFDVYTKNTDTGVKTLFSLADYTGVVEIYDAPGGILLYSSDDADSGHGVTLAATSYTWDDFVDVAEGKLFWWFKITNTTDANDVWVPHYGDFINSIKP